MMIGGSYISVLLLMERGGSDVVLVDGDTDGFRGKLSNNSSSSSFFLFLLSIVGRGLEELMFREPRMLAFLLAAILKRENIKFLK